MSLPVDKLLAGRNILSGPGFADVDLSIAKDTKIKERVSMQFRCEAFNLFNHSNWGNPTVSQGSTSLTNGNVTSTAGDPRIMQFALKFNF